MSMTCGTAGRGVHTKTCSANLINMVLTHPPYTNLTLHVKHIQPNLFLQKWLICKQGQQTHKTRIGHLHAPDSSPSGKESPAHNEYEKGWASVQAVGAVRNPKISCPYRERYLDSSVVQSVA